MARKVYQARIDSIEGGRSVYDYFSADDQYVTARNLDIDSLGYGPTVLRPNTYGRYDSGDTIGGTVLWIADSPQKYASGNDLFMYDINGSVYTRTPGSNSVTGLTDLNDGGDAYGNGMAYYDNYLYCARATTVARYGPLNGTPTWTDDYWVGVLGKPQLKQQPMFYRNSGYSEGMFPNHVMHRHIADGALYFCDVSDGQGVIHKIVTKKTTVAGDTDGGSKYGALYLPDGYIPSTIESLGESLVVAAFEGAADSPEGYYTYDGGNASQRASLFFWDTTSEQYYLHIQDEFPDFFISALKNANGVLYTFSCNSDSYEPKGCRVMRYLGGSSFEQLAYLQNADTPYQGGVAARHNQIVFASNYQDYAIDYGAAIYSIGAQSMPLSNVLYCVAGAVSSTQTADAIFAGEGTPWSQEFPYTTTEPSTESRLQTFGASTGYQWDTDLLYSVGSSASFMSRWFTTGQRGKILRIRIYYSQVFSQSQYQPDLYVYINKNHSINMNEVAQINKTNFPEITEANHSCLELKPSNMTFEHSFQLYLRWKGASPLQINLPIVIDYELYDE